uniref:SEFIR domain-containing protein n=1 Tax=Monopterus albus TaxID=43700 RepID=A0A3Q3ILX0_MONAL
MILYTLSVLRRLPLLSLVPDLPSTSDTSPSFPEDLNVKQVTVEGTDMLNISWAINIDASIEYLTGTRIEISGELAYLCEYSPRFAQAGLTGSKKRWFHFLVMASEGYHLIQASNLPLPPVGSGNYIKYTSIELFPSRLPATVTPEPTQVPTDFAANEILVSSLRTDGITVIISGGLACLIILGSCYIIYKTCGANITKSFGLKSLPMVPVPVLVVYPAENSVFQQAVVALTEFLQWHGNCSVAVDMWQQGKIADLGPMRWLAEQVKAADRVLIVCPQSSSQPSHSPPTHSFPEPSIPAAAYDLYPLILNMVASNAKNAKELAKFWVVQLGEQQAKRHSNLALELRSCSTFYLMKNLNQLCRSLHTQREGNKAIFNLIFRPEVVYSEKSTVKLREAVENLSRHQLSISSEMEPLRSVVSSV